jgi:hypothetical protein
MYLLSNNEEEWRGEKHCLLKYATKEVEWVRDKQEETTRGEN